MSSQGANRDPYVTAFSSPHRADIGDYAAVTAKELLDQIAPDKEVISRSQAVEIARQAADLALPRLLIFVGAGDLDLYTGDGEEVVRFSVNPEKSNISGENTTWSWINDQRPGE